MCYVFTGLAREIGPTGRIRLAVNPLGDGWSALDLDNRLGLAADPAAEDGFWLPADEVGHLLGKFHEYELLLDGRMGSGRPAAETFPPDWPRTKKGRPRRPPRPFPPRPGVYVIRLGRQTYSGGSPCVLGRLDDHLRRLALGDHENPALQAVYNRLGGRVSVSVRPMPGATNDDLAVAERAVLGHLLRLGSEPINQQLRPLPTDYEPDESEWRVATGPKARSRSRGAA